MFSKLQAWHPFPREFPLFPSIERQRSQQNKKFMVRQGDCDDKNGYPFTLNENLNCY